MAAVAGVLGARQKNATVADLKAGTDSYHSFSHTVKKGVSTINSRLSFYEGTTNYSSHLALCLKVLRGAQTTAQLSGTSHTALEHDLVETLRSKVDATDTVTDVVLERVLSKPWAHLSQDPSATKIKQAIAGFVNKVDCAALWDVIRGSALVHQLRRTLGRTFFIGVVGTGTLFSPSLCLVSRLV
jgi:hypothetical protein